jgi:hypothetical protein
MMVSVTVDGDFVLLIMAKFWESGAGLFLTDQGWWERWNFSSPGAIFTLEPAVRVLKFLFTTNIYTNQYSLNVFSANLKWLCRMFIK